MHLKKVTETLKITIHQLAYPRIYLKSLRDAFFVNYPFHGSDFVKIPMRFSQRLQHLILFISYNLKNGNQQLIKENHLVRY